MAKKYLEFQGKHFEIAYEIIDYKQSQWIVFLHGWGSNKELMKQAFKDCFTQFNHLYLDLPGFGQSFNQSVLTTQDYAEILKLFFAELKMKAEFIVGHSFGGKVATLLTPRELLLLSSAGIVCPKPLSVRLKIILAKVAKMTGFSLKALRSKDADRLNEEMYQTFKNVVDEDFTPIFKACTSRVYIFWGAQDQATPLSSGEKIHSFMTKSFFLPLNGDHYFFLKHYQMIEKQTLQWRESIE